MTERNSFDYSTKIIPIEPSGSVIDGGQNSIGVDIVGDRELSFGGKLLVVEPDTFVLNALLKSGPDWATCSEMQDSVGFSFSKPTWTRRLNKLRDGLSELLGWPDAIEGDGSFNQNRVYRFSPLLQFTDRRTGDELFLHTNVDRRRCFGEMFRAIWDEPDFKQLQSQIIIESQRLNGKAKELPARILASNLALINTGLNGYLHDGFEAARDKIVAAAAANERVYYSTTHIIEAKSFAIGKRYNGDFNDDFLQAGLNGLCIFCARLATGLNPAKYMIFPCRKLMSPQVNLDTAVYDLGRYAVFHTQAMPLLEQKIAALLSDNEKNHPEYAIMGRDLDTFYDALATVTARHRNRRPRASH